MSLSSNSRILKRHSDVEPRQSLALSAGLTSHLTTQLSCTAELFATVRDDNCRILEGVKSELFGESGHQVTHPSHPEMASRSRSTQGPPISGLRRDISAIVSSRDASVVEENSASIPAKEFLKMLGETELAQFIGLSSLYFT